MDIQLSREEISSIYKKSLEWGKKELEEGKETKLLVFSELNDPRIWNPLEKQLMDNLEAGMEYIHCTGPMICTDSQGVNSVLNVYENSPEKMALKIQRLPSLEKFFLLSSDERENITYVGEELPKSSETEIYNPLREKRKCIVNVNRFKNPNDKQMREVSYLKSYHAYDITKVLMDDASDMKEIPTITENEVYELVNRLKEGVFTQGAYFEDIEIDDQTITRISTDPITDKPKTSFMKLEYHLLTAQKMRDILNMKEDKKYIL